jgi:acyl dehydratase
LPAPREIDISELPQLVGERLGTSSWHVIDQGRIDRFADVTEDRQWIHIDPERAAATPIGSTIAHGYLTLSLGPALLDEIFQVDRCAMVVNYGIDRLRFTAPVPVGSRVRLQADLAGLEQAKDGSLQASLGLTFELEASGRPCLVAQIVFRYYAEEQPQPL